MMLAQSLKELTLSGIVHREQYNEVPPRVEYRLTDKGKSIITPLEQLAGWGADHMQEDKTCTAFCDTCQSIK
jgi:DNA-binding HxlR family transcriptional regulator